MSILSGKNIILGVSGSIAAYKALEIIRLFKKNKANINTIATNAALKFIGTASFEALSGNPCLVDNFQNSTISHINYAKNADIMLIAPATANTIAKIAHGFADNLLLTTVLSFTGKIFIAPAMETNMWHNKAVADNIKKLTKRNITILGPTIGELASGDYGMGRMMQPEEILQNVESSQYEKDFAGKKVLITGGPTVENIDPVRFISNRSSGKMAVSLAKALTQRGAEVTFIHGPMTAQKFDAPNISYIAAGDAASMCDAVLSNITNVHMAIFAAAVADYRSKQILNEKIKKFDQHYQLNLIANPDIISQVTKLENKPFIVGFAAETSNIIDNAKQKLHNKKCDMICVNDVSKKDIGFDAEHNSLTIIKKTQEIINLPKMTKSKLAHEVLNNCL